MKEVNNSKFKKAGIFAQSFNVLVLEFYYYFAL